MFRFMRSLSPSFSGFLIVFAVLASAPAFSAISSDTRTIPSSQTNVNTALASEIHYILAKNGRSVRYELLKGLPGRPVYVTFNGLIYNQKYWDPFLKALNETGATIIRYSYSADPESLVAKSEGSTATKFTLASVSTEVEAVLDDAGFGKVTLLTLSYGSIGIEFAAQHPERVERVVLMAPMVLPNDAYDAAGSATRAYLESVRLLWGETAYDFQWTLLMEPTVRSLVYKRVNSIPGYVPEALSTSDVVDGAVEKIKATRRFDLRDYTQKKLPRVDLMLAGDEESVLLLDQKDFWRKLPESAKGTLILVRDAAHALPATAPAATLKALSLLQVTTGGAIEMTPNGEILAIGPR